MKNNLSNRVSTIVADRISYFQTLDAEANFLRSKTAPTFSRGQDPSPSFDGQPCFRGIADMDRFSTPNDLSRMPSRPGEFHPEPLTDPDLNLSIHPARVTARRLPPSAEPSGSSRFDPVGPCSTAMTCPLRSTGITRLPRYYEPLRHPRAPGLSLTGVRLVVPPTTLWGFPCCVRFPCVHAVATTPAQRLEILLRSFRSSRVSLPR